MITITTPSSLALTPSPVRPVKSRMVRAAFMSASRAVEPAYARPRLGQRTNGRCDGPFFRKTSLSQSRSLRARENAGDQLRCHSGAHRPAHHTPGEEVDDGGHIEPAPPSRHT